MSEQQREHSFQEGDGDAYPPTKKRRIGEEGGTDVRSELSEESLQLIEGTGDEFETGSSSVDREVAPSSSQSLQLIEGTGDEFETGSSSVDREVAPSSSQSQTDDLDGEGVNISQNKNPTLWCVPLSESSSGFWDPIVSKSYDHSVDDPLFWGPYLSERQWGTVREDFSEDDNCWEHVSYEDATHHAYVSGEDGLMGVSDKCQLLCASLALWNGKDPILKERLFGLTSIEGNHGEDVKELYYYLDNVPDHSYMRGLYKYPQAAFPYKWLREENKNRSFGDPEFELIDTGVFEQSGHWDVTVEYAKTDHLGLACQLEVANNGRHKETIHVMPQFWFRHVQRNEPIPLMPGNQTPKMKSTSEGHVNIQYSLGSWRLVFMQDSKQKPPTLLFTDNVSLAAAEKNEPNTTIYSKDAFHKYIIHGKADAVNPGNTGTKCGAYYELTVEAGCKMSVIWRIESYHYPTNYSLADLQNIFVKKKKDAQSYYSSLMPSWSQDERIIGTQAIAGLFWSKQYYMFDVKNWLDDFRRCQANRGRKGRNSSWSHVHNHHILLMPDKWEFPWYAGWDLCVSAVLYSRYSTTFAKQQLLVFLSDCFMHPQGQLPGCEFDLGDPNPPLQPWAVLGIFYRDGSTDYAFLQKCFHRLLLNYNWWCNREFESTNTYGRGFLGMDNISVTDRSGHLPPGWNLVQADCTAWMGCYAMWMLKMAVELGQFDLVYCDLIPRFLNQFLNVAIAMNKPISEKGLWDEDDRFFYDVFHTPQGPVPVKLRSMAGLVPLLGCTKIKLQKFATVTMQFEPHITDYPQHICRLKDDELYLSLMCLPRIQSVLERVFSEKEFLAPYGIRSMSKEYEEHPYSQMVGDQYMTIRYAPAESDCGAFGGNSNWRGPVWIFMNYLLLESLDITQARAERSHSSLMLNKAKDTPSIAERITNLEKRLLSIFLPDKEGARPIHGLVSRYANDPKWRNLVLFYEFINAETGRGCGASHQTGWTAAIVEIIYRLHGEQHSSLGPIH